MYAFSFAFLFFFLLQEATTQTIWVIALGNLCAIITLIIKNIFDERKAERIRKADKEDREAKLKEQEIIHRQHIEATAQEAKRLASELALKTKLEAEKANRILVQHQDQNRDFLVSKLEETTSKLQENTNITKEAAEIVEQAKTITKEIKEKVDEISQQSKSDSKVLS